MKSKQRQQEREQRKRATPIIRALADFHGDKPPRTRCPYCDSIITIDRLGDSAWSSHCDCGKCNDTLRGL
ncbi:MAG: hypothetical protein ABL921_33960 [Pirellula sp.]